MKCPKCGKENQDYYVYCEECGTKLEKLEKNVEAYSPKESGIGEEVKATGSQDNSSYTQLDPKAFEDNSPVVNDPYSNGLEPPKENSGNSSYTPIVPIVPAGGDNASQNNGYQNQTAQNAGYQNNGYQNQAAQNAGYQNNGYQNQAAQNAGYQNNGYQNNAYGGSSYQNRPANTYNNTAYNSGVNRSNITEEELPADLKPLSPWAYLGYSLLFGIPLVGIIMIFVYGFGSTVNKNLKNFSRYYLIIYGISLIFTIIYIVLFIAGMSAMGGFSEMG